MQKSVVGAHIWFKYKTISAHAIYMSSLIHILANIVTLVLILASKSNTKSAYLCKVINFAEQHSFCQWCG